MSETTNYFWVGVVCALLVGGFISYGLFPRTVEKTIEKTVPVEKIVTVEKNITVEKLVPGKITDFRETAIKTVFDKLHNKDSFLTCGNTTYDKDQVSISRVYDDWSYTGISEDDGKYSVTYTAKYAFDDKNDDDKACKETRTYKVTYETDEKPVVALQ